MILLSSVIILASIPYGCVGLYWVIIACKSSLIDIFNTRLSFTATSSCQLIYVSGLILNSNWICLYIGNILPMVPFTESLSY